MVDQRRASADRRGRTRGEALRLGLRVSVVASLIVGLAALAVRTVVAGVDAHLAGGAIPVPSLGLAVVWAVVPVAVLGLLLTLVAVARGSRRRSYSVPVLVGVGSGVRRWPGPAPADVSEAGS